MQMNEIITLSVGIIIAVIFVAYLIVNQRNKVLEWLKYAVAEAEKQLGDGTGQLKLRLVFDWFCEKFPYVATVVPFKVFSAWVDTALATMKHWLEVGSPIGDYIVSKESEKDVALHK